MRKYRPPLMAHEVITVYTLNGVANKFMGRYIVVGEITTSDAAAGLPLREGEEVLTAREMQEYKVVIKKRKQRNNGSKNQTL